MKGGVNEKCQEFMLIGNCKKGLRCKYYHPSLMISQRAIQWQDLFKTIQRQQPVGKTNLKLAVQKRREKEKQKSVQIDTIQVPKKDFHFDEEFLNEIQAKNIREEIDDEVFVKEYQDCPCCEGFILSCSGPECSQMCVCANDS